MLFLFKVDGMNDERRELRQSIALLNSILIPVFILFLVDKINLSFLVKYSFILVFILTASLKIYFMSAVGGCILEIISGEDFVFQFRRLHQNAMKLWPGFLSIFVLVRLIDFIIFVLFPSFRIYKPVYFSLLEVMAAFALSQWAVNKKYIAPLDIPRRKFKFRLNFLMVLILAYLLELILIGVLSSINIGGFYWRNMLSFMLVYIHAFEFIFSAFYILEQYPLINERYQNKNEVFLINPMGAEIVQSLSYWFMRLHPPVFVVLKALTPKTYKFREFNQVVWHERYYKTKVLVCITCFTSNCYEAYKIAKEFKKRGAKVVMGGPHVTYMAHEALAFCDSVIIGQAEGVWRQVIRDYEAGVLQSQYRGPATEDDYAQVHKELLNSPPTIIKDFLETMRGCKFRCHFCSVPTLSGGQIHLQPINSFIELIKKVKCEHSHVIFIDNNIYSDPAYARELFMALKPLKIKWHSQCTIDIAKNQETLRLARESGCAGLLFGYEVSGESFEKKQGGKFGMAQKYREYTQIIKKAGISIKGHFIFGFDSDNLKSLFQLWKFCFSIMPQFTALSLLTPLPGSGVYQDMLREDRIINLNWRSYGLIRMVVRHPQMNHTAVSFFFPLIRAFFLLTTSSIGILFSIVVLFFPRYGLVDSFFR